MFHEVTYNQARRRIAMRIVALILIMAFLAASYFGGKAIEANAREQAALSLRESVLIAAKQCCAVEGSYPASIEHLEQYYGLTINHDNYVVSYEWFAENVLPSVVVTAR